MYHGLGTVISLMYTPIMLRQLGDSEFGVYQAVLPIISYLEPAELRTGQQRMCRYYFPFSGRPGTGGGAPSSTGCSW